MKVRAFHTHTYTHTDRAQVITVLQNLVSSLEIHAFDCDKKQKKIGKPKFFKAKNFTFYAAAVTQQDKGKRNNWNTKILYLAK